MLGTLLLVFAQIMVGINIVTCKYLLTQVQPLFLLSVRFTFATCLSLLLHFIFDDKNIALPQRLRQLSKCDWFYTLMQAVSAGLLFNWLMISGLNYTDANVAGIITSALPALITIMSWLILGDKMSTKKYFCLFFATIGLMTLAIDKCKQWGDTHSVVGDLIVLASLIPEASYYVLHQFHTVRLPVFLMSALLNGMNAVIIVALCCLNQTAWPALSLDDSLILIMLSFTSTLFFVLWLFGSKHVDGMMASLTTAVAPLATVVLAWVILGEQLTWMQSLGMGFVMISIVTYAKR